MNDVITILFEAEPNDDRVESLKTDLLGIEGVESVGADATRSIGIAELGVWVSFAADALGVATAAASIVKGIGDRVRSRGVRRAVIELPNGVRISIDNASVDEITSIVSAWKDEEASWSRGAKPRG
jgi:hypothetical protein